MSPLDLGRTLRAIDPSRVGTAVVVGAVLAATSVTVAAAANGQANRKERTGAELYGIYCARCHSERYPTERTDAQWKTIMLHMRTRAQLSGEDAAKILDYLKENN